MESVIDLFTSSIVDAGMNTVIITDCKAALGCSPRHAGIDCNEQADILAKEVLKDSPISAEGQLSLLACKKLVAKHTKRLSQQRWDRSTTRRVTYN